MNIAFLAHDKKKELMVQFCTAYKSVLMKHNLFATATTGRLIADNTGLPITLLLSHKQGGHQQINARIAYNEIDLVMMFTDPNSTEAWDDARMVETRHRAGFDHELADFLAGRRAVRLQNLHGDVLVELRMPGLPHNGHASLANIRFILNTGNFRRICLEIIHHRAPFFGREPSPLHLRQGVAPLPRQSGQTIFPTP